MKGLFGVEYFVEGIHNLWLFVLLVGVECVGEIGVNRTMGWVVCGSLRVSRLSRVNGDI